jgi:hypothetical protein
MDIDTDRPLLGAVSNQPWVVIGAILLAIALVLHAIFPRYEWRSVDTDGRAIVVYDRWAGRFQRAAWQADGTVQAMSLWAPF